MGEVKELVEQWIQKAEHDLGVAKLTLENKPEFTDSICFHSQQAVEKYLKAYLILLDIAYQKTHNLVYLLDLIKEKEDISDDYYDLIEKLEDYAVEIRYPDDWFEPTLEDAQEAYEIANKLKDFILGKIKPKK